MKLVRDFCNNKDIIAVEVGDEIPLHIGNCIVKEINRGSNKRTIILENELGEIYITDDSSLQSIIK